MSSLVKGDLVYAPSGVYLYKKSEGEIQTYVKLTAPRNLLLVDLSATDARVIYENQEWLVHKKDIFGVENA
jgi:hypothetical protein